MDAGRELDATVAEKVMGLQVMIHNPGSGEWRTLYAGGDTPLLPYYSSDPAAAWSVVERMRELGWYWEIVGRSNEPYIGAWFYGGPTNPSKGTHDGYADTMPLAVCRAALAALEESKP